MPYAKQISGRDMTHEEGAINYSIYLNNIAIDLSINVDELSFAMLIIKQKEEQLRFILSFYFLNEYILLAFIPSL